MHGAMLKNVWDSAHARNDVICLRWPKCLIAVILVDVDLPYWTSKVEHIAAFTAIFSNNCTAHAQKRLFINFWCKFWLSSSPLQHSRTTVRACDVNPQIKHRDSIGALTNSTGEPVTSDYQKADVLWSWRFTVGECVINMCTQPWRDRVASIVL